MCNKLFVLSVAAVLGVVGCSKEEGNGEVSPVIDQLQQSSPAGSITPETVTPQQPQMPSTQEASPAVMTTTDTKSQMKPAPTTSVPMSAPQNVSVKVPVVNEPTSTPDVSMPPATPVDQTSTLPPTTSPDISAPTATVPSSMDMVVEEVKPSTVGKVKQVSGIPVDVNSPASDVIEQPLQ